MNDDPIVAEVRATREKIFAECGYDLDRFNAHMREVGERHKREGWPVANRPVVRRSTSQQSTHQESFIVREDPPTGTQS